ncbi:MAG: nucleotidyltransferase family protein [Anaerolineales bacterium]|nr:nucleotidyltransferase family protein [Anaerolineales bacterium]
MTEKVLNETELLLDALRLGQTAAGWQAECGHANANLDALAVRAIVLGLAPQLHHRLAAWHITLPPRAAAKLAVTYQAQEQRSAAIFSQLAEVLKACAENGLKPIALKGVHLAGLVYAAPALRPMNDIDLLFTPEELPSAEHLLETLGYGGKHKSAAVGPGVVKHTSTYQRDANSAATSNPYLSTESARMIEPHSSLEESWFGLKVDVTPGVHERAAEAVLAQQPVRILSIEDLVLHLSVHLCFHIIAGAPAMVQLLDLKAVTQLNVNWAVVASRARATRATPFVLAALTLAHKLLDTPLPAEISGLAHTVPSGLRRYIAELGLPHLLRRTQQKPLTSVAERIRRGLSDRAETARWTGNWGEWARVWLTAININKTDTGRLLAKQVIAKIRTS